MADYRNGDTVGAVLQRRRNADAVDISTPSGRLYRRLLHLQIDLQVEGDEEAEETLCELLDDWTGYQRRKRE